MTKAELKEIRNAFSDYKYSEGCDCCRNADAHNDAEVRLARLLKVPMYSDKSGYDFSKFRTKKKVVGR